MYFDATPHGLSGPLNFSWEFYVENSISYQWAYGQNASVSFAVSGGVEVSLWVYWPNGTLVANPTARATINPALVACPLASPDPGDAGSPVTFEPNPGILPGCNDSMGLMPSTAGSSPETLYWSFGDGTNATAYNTSNLYIAHGAATLYQEELNHTYRLPGSYSVTMRANDSAGAVFTTSFPVSMGNPLLLSLSPSPATVDLGSRMSFVATLSGGYPPYSYSYAGLPPGCVSADSSSIGCTPTQLGTYHVSLEVYDSRNALATANVTIQVQAPRATSANAWVLPAIAGAGVATVVWGGTFAWIRHRRRSRTPPIAGRAAR